MAAERVFTVEEVTALIPTLSELVGKQLQLQSKIEEGIAELARVTGKLPDDFEPVAGESDERRRLKEGIKRSILSYESGWTRIQELGAVVKDPRIGLLDFYGHVDGRLVCLCWRHGEESLDWYHSLDAGFAGRKRLDRRTKEQLLN